MKKLLWIGDAAVATGFARCTHHILEQVRKTWDVAVLGLNHQGDPHSYPYPIYPCWPGGDAFGVNRTVDIIGREAPDVVVIQNDPWNMKEYLRVIQEAGLRDSLRLVAYVAIDGKNCAYAQDLNEFDLCVFWTEFAREEARRGGFTGASDVIPLGVDLDVYQPVDRNEARVNILGDAVPADAFIVGNVNRNQPRKRLDLTVEYFAEWAHRSGVGDAYLFALVAPTGEVAYDLPQLMQFWGFKKGNPRLIHVVPNIVHGIPEENLKYVYSCFDVQISTTQGEGWGLTTMEGMACGVPQIVPEWSALSEWADAAIQVPCTSHCVTPNKINVIGGVPDKEEFIRALDLLHMSRSWSDNNDGWLARRKAGFDLVRRPEYRWPAIGSRFAESLAKLGATEKVA